MSEADYAILTSRGSDYDNLRKQADFHHIPTLTPSFITDSEAQGVFLTTADYLIAPAESAPPVARGRKRKSEGGGGSSSKKHKSPYTDEEKQEFLAYVRRLLKKTPTMTVAELGPFLHQRVCGFFLALSSLQLTWYLCGRCLHTESRRGKVTVGNINQRLRKSEAELRRRSSRRR